MSVTLCLLIALLLSWVLTRVVRQYALKTHLLDRPNERSSHTVPTPRGGGLAIVLSFLALVLVLPWILALPLGLIGVVWPGAALVATVGWIDDRRPLAARWRFLAHLAAATAAVWIMGGIPPVPMFGYHMDLHWLGAVLAILYVAWMTNLYNFMDGIDGIAGIEAITVLFGAALCWWLAEPTPQWVISALLGCCAAGFLVWNYPPARIFMGDAGSGFLGYVIGVLSLWSAQQATHVFWCWLILIGCFMVDATLTLVRRVLRGERFYEAHRSHAYQYASRLHASHESVSLTVGALNVFWLLPWALAVALQRIDGAVALVLAYAPLVWLAFRYKAGDRAAQSA